MSRVLWLLLTGGGFLLGGIMFCRILPKALAGTDVCALSPDHNPGTANVFIYCGWKLGLLCLLLDMGKGYLPVFAACRLSDGMESPMLSAVMLAPVLGHAMAPFSHQKGGKCIACAFGVLLGLLPGSHMVLVLAALYILLSTLFKINPTRKRSIVTFSLFACISLAASTYTKAYAVGIGCLLISSVVVAKHLPRCDQQPAEQQKELSSAL